MIFATGNMGKMKEIKAILGDIGEEILSMKEAGIDMDIVEDGSTFEENAIIKAKAVMERTGKLALADDSGLEIDALNKEPGIYSARYMGEDTPYEIKNSNLIERMKGVKGKDRSARFVCVIAAAFPDGEIITTRGTIEGVIAEEPAGENGFGYDPIVYVPEYGMTTGQMDPDAKMQSATVAKHLQQ